MREERLLERLRAIENNPDRRETQNIARLIKSILNHMQRILNTRQGSVLLDPNFGMPDFTNLTSAFRSDTMRDIERALKSLIQKYEPRLDRVMIKFLSPDDDILALRLKISALLYDENNVPVEFDTVISGDGRVKISQ